MGKGAQRGILAAPRQKELALHKEGKSGAAASREMEERGLRVWVMAVESLFFMGHAVLGTDLSGQVVFRVSF